MPGGLYAQHPKLIDQWRYIFKERAAYEEEKQRKEESKRRGESGGRGGGRVAGRTRKR